MLKSISLKFTEAGPIEVPAQGVTIFVGPNNTGKSLVLRELEADISSHQPITTKLLSDFEIVWLDESQLSADIASLTKKIRSERRQITFMSDDLTRVETSRRTTLIARLLRSL